MHTTLRLISLLVLTGCAGFFEPSESVEVRVANESDVRFDDIVVGFPAAEVEYGSLAPDSASAFVAVGTAYRYAYVEVRVDGEELRLVPIDYVGEAPLESGRYTYVIGLDAGGSSLSLRLVRN